MDGWVPTSPYTKTSSSVRPLLCISQQQQQQRNYGPYSCFSPFDAAVVVVNLAAGEGVFAAVAGSHANS